MRRGLKLWSTNIGTYYDEAKRLYDKKLFDYIELYIVPNSIETLPQWQKLSIPFIIHNAHFMQGFNLANKEKEYSNTILYQETKLFADTLNALWIIFHAGIDGDSKETVRQLKAFNENRALIENKPFVALPNRMGGNECRGATKAELEYIIKETGCGFCLDFGHALCAANALHLEPYAFIHDLLQLEPVLFHLTDVEDMHAVHDTHLHLGKGQMNIPYLLQLTGNKPITFETEKNSKINLNDFEEDMLWLNNIQ